MTPDELKLTLIDNISFQLRHPQYDRAIEVKKTARMISAAVGWEEEVTRYRRWEDDKLKEQRIRLSARCRPDCGHPFESRSATECRVRSRTSPG